MRRAIMLSIMMSLLSLANCVEAEAVKTTIHEFDLGPVSLKVQKPEGWHAYAMGANDALGFRIVREKNEDGTYFTGTTINIVMEVSKKSNASPSQYAPHYFAQQLKKNGVKPLEFFKEKKVDGGFLRSGLRVEEDLTINGKTEKHTVNHSVFANDEADFMIIAIFGTPSREWKDTSRYLEATLGFSLDFKPEKPVAP